MSLEYPRTELIPTVIFDTMPVSDPNAYLTTHGRLIPGHTYARMEHDRLMSLAEADTLPFTPLPTPQQLGRISINVFFGCWELPVYQDAQNRARYGNLTVAGLQNPSGMAHRTMYQVFYGAESLPDSTTTWLDHLCENKACCYPRHLELVTPGENTRRARQHDVTGQLPIEYA